MTSHTAQDLSAASLDEQVITQYLQQHPDLFDRHPQLLTRLRLTHPRSGATVSLIERQVDVLRERHAALEQQLADFVRVARANEALAEKIHRFTRRLVATSTRAAALAQIEASLREDFDAYHAVLVLRGAAPTDVAGQRTSALRPGARHPARFPVRQRGGRYRFGGPDPAHGTQAARSAGAREPGP